MEHNAQSPVIERPGAEELEDSDVQQQQKQAEEVKANTDSRSLKSNKQSSSFSRLPRNVIERYVSFFLFFFFPFF